MFVFNRATQKLHDKRVPVNPPAPHQGDAGAHGLAEGLQGLTQLQQLTLTLNWNQIGPKPRAEVGGGGRLSEAQLQLWAE